MQILSINQALSGRYVKQDSEQPVQQNFGALRLCRRNIFNPESDSSRVKFELVNYMKYFFNIDVKVGENVKKNNMLLTLARKMKKENAPNSENTFNEASNLLTPKNPAQILLLNNRFYTSDETLRILKILNSKNRALAEKLLSLRAISGNDLDLSGCLYDVLSSNSAPKLNKSFHEYQSYIILNAAKENFSKNLEKELESTTPSFNYKELDKYIAIKKKQISSPILMKISDDVLLNGNYNAVEFLSRGYFSQILFQVQNLNEKDYDFIEYFIQTSNQDNFDLRSRFLRKRFSSISLNESLENIKKLFTRMDEDDNFYNLLDIVLDNNELASQLNIKEFMFYTDKFGSENLLKHVDNFVNILLLHKYGYNPDQIAEIISANLKNRYYTTDRGISLQKKSAKYKGPWARFKGDIVRMVKYNIMPKFAGKTESVSPLNDIKFKDYNFGEIKVTESVSTLTPEVMQPEVIKSVEVSSNIEKPVVDAAEINSQIMGADTIKPVDLTVKSEEIAVQVDDVREAPVKKKIVREYKPEDPKINAKKLKIFNESQEIVRSRMKSKAQIEEQVRDYSLTATKIRNKYLNAIFDYVADVRKAENRKGIKRHSVSNYDVLELYQKINGYNRKEFRRMLTARTETGERMYSFAEINKMLDDSIIEHYKLLREKQAARLLAKQNAKLNTQST